MNGHGYSPQAAVKTTTPAILNGIIWGGVSRSTVVSPRMSGAHSSPAPTVSYKLHHPFPPTQPHQLPSQKIQYQHSQTIPPNSTKPALVANGGVDFDSTRFTSDDGPLRPFHSPTHLPFDPSCPKSSLFNINAADHGFGSGDGNFVDSNQITQSDEPVALSESDNITHDSWLHHPHRSRSSTVSSFSFHHRSISENSTLMHRHYDMIEPDDFDDDTAFFPSTDPHFVSQTVEDEWEMI